MSLWTGECVNLDIVRSVTAYGIGESVDVPCSVLRALCFSVLAHL